MTGRIGHQRGIGVLALGFERVRYPIMSMRARIEYYTFKMLRPLLSFINMQQINLSGLHITLTKQI